MSISKVKTPAAPLFKDFLTALGNLLSCGLLDVVENAISQHRGWFNRTTSIYEETTFTRESARASLHRRKSEITAEILLAKRAGPLRT